MTSYYWDRQDIHSTSVALYHYLEWLKKFAKENNKSFNYEISLISSLYNFFGNCVKPGDKIDVVEINPNVKTRTKI